ncbi:solute carrier family 35 member G1-like [Brevipalpus obovatus]|uniref:solute carrier family 35 member G1-like n=1 Tax=Brevipalpus obovatus TaxID=246614 RepID=UPI003D9E495F
MNSRRVSLASAAEDIVVHTNERVGSLDPVIIVETVKKDNPQFLIPDSDGQLSGGQSNGTRLSVGNISVRSADSRRSRRSLASVCPVPESARKVENRSSELIISAWKSFRGIFFAILAALFFATGSAIVKSLEHVDSSFMALIQFVGIGILSSVALLNTNEFIFGDAEDRPWLFFRGVTGCLAWYFRYKSLNYLALTNVVIINLSNLVFVSMFARFFLKEPFTMLHFIGMILTMIGIGFSIRIDKIIMSFTGNVQMRQEQEQKGLGLLFGLSSAIFSASSIITLRKLKQSDQFVITFNLSWVASTILLVITYFTNNLQLPESPHDSWLLVLIALASFFGQIMLTKALHYQEAATISVTRAASDIMFAFLIQTIVFQNMPDLYTIIGALFVSMTIVLVNLKIYISRQPEDHTLRRWFALIM